jgi:carbon starvation protein CstA
MRRLRDGEWIAGAGAVALLASMFLHWYRLDLPSPAGGLDDPFAPEATAWQAFGVLDVVLALLALVPLALVVTQATRKSPAIPVFLSVMTVLAGALAALLILYRIVNQPGENQFVEVQVGAWLGFLAALVIGAGGWRSTRVEAVPGDPARPIEEQPLPAP